MALFVVSVPVFLLLSNVRVAAMEPRVYEYSFETYDAPARTGIDRTQLNRAAQDIAHYFRNDEPLLTTRVIIDGDDYDDADLWFRVNTEVPSLILLYQGRGKEKHNIAINLDSASYYRVDVLKERDWVYTVHVYW